MAVTTKGGGMAKKRDETAALATFCLTSSSAPVRALVTVGWRMPLRRSVDRGAA